MVNNQCFNIQLAKDFCTYLFKSLVTRRLQNILASTLISFQFKLGDATMKKLCMFFFFFFGMTGKFPSEEKKGEKIHFPLTMVMEMRVMKKSDTLLCPASITNSDSEEHIAYIEILSVSGTPGYEQYFTDVALAWKKLGGIPHWQKQWTFLQDKDTDIFGYINNKYGANLSTFMNVRQQLKLDPKNLFMNGTMEKVFEPTK